MNKTFCLIITLILLNTAIVYSAPAMRGLALNQETKECAGYWSGDEFTHYDLPNGWNAYYPDYEKGNVIETEIGTCIVTDMEDCCNQFNYTYVSHNIGKGRLPKGGMLPSEFRYVMFLYIGFLIVGFIISLYLVIKHILKKKK